MAIRLKDIAEDLGISQMTVSKVLRGKQDVGEATRERVLRRVKELNYRPNMLARGLASGKTFSAGLIVPDLVHPFFAEFARSLAGVLRDGEYALLMASSEEDPAIEEQEIRTLLQRRVDVLVLASCWTAARPSEALKSAKVPVLLVDRVLPYLRKPFVGTDDVRAGEIAAEHLLSTGCNRIAHIGGTRRLSPARDREAGFRRALQRAGRRLPASFVIHNDLVEESGEGVGYRAMQKLAALRHRPDAIFCYNDATAMGAMQAALDAGLRIPQDIAVMGCGNLRYADYLRVPLTSLDQGTAEMGRRAGELALRMGQPGEVAIAETRLEPTLVVRASTRAL